MAILAKWATNGYDLHLVAPQNQTQDRTFQLGDYFLPDAVTPWSTNHLGWNDPFKPVFDFTPTTHGVQVTKTGALTFVQQGAVAKIRNFIVDAFRINNQGDEERASIRIHRHDLLLGVVLTPNKLTVRRGSAARVSVLAIFQDIVDGVPVQCVGDISYQPRLAWDVLGAIDTVVDSQTGFIKPGANSGTTGTVQVLLPDELFWPPTQSSPLRTVTAEFRIAPAWDTPLADRVKLVGGPGLAKLSKVPNILFLPDGFTSPDEFHQAVDALVGTVRSAPTMTPWNRFLDEKKPFVNYWKAWVPSPEEGGCDLNELHQTTVRSKATAAAPFVPSAVKPEGDQIENLANLIYRVGLPTALDATRTFAGQQQIWNGLYSAVPTYLLGLTSSLWQQWKALAVRVMAKEVDTTFGIRIGHRPQFPLLSPIVMGLHPFRATRADIDKTLAKLFIQRPGGGTQPIGNRWVSGAPDAEFVVILSKGPWRRGTHSGGDHLISSTLTDRSAALLDQVPTQPTIATLNVPPIADDLAIPAHVLVHELTHAFHIGDEYSRDVLNFPTTNAVAVDSAQEKYWNLIVNREARDQAGNLTRAGIRWSEWPRVVVADVVDPFGFTITPGTPDDHIRIKLSKGAAAAFQAAHDGGKIPDHGFFRLRLQPFVNFIKQGSPPVQVPKPDQMSPLMTLVSIDVTNDVINLDEFVSKTLASWKAANAPNSVTLVLLAVVATAEGERPVMHPAIATHIVDTNKRPLNRSPAAPDTCAKSEDDVMVPVGLQNFRRDINPPNGLFTQVIGLFDGGATYSCGIYHAAAACRMRSSSSIEELDPKAVVRPGQKTTSAAKFCHVCRYLLVDQIAPTLHKEMDELYEGESYPK